MQKNPGVWASSVKANLFTAYRHFISTNSNGSSTIKGSCTSLSGEALKIEYSRFIRNSEGDPEETHRMSMTIAVR